VKREKAITDYHLSDIIAFRILSLLAFYKVLRRERELKGFALDANGDVLITNNEISMVFDADLIRQTVETVLGTKKGEWSLNIEEGINFSNILGKQQNEEIIKNEILQGLLQVDDTFVINDFSCELDREKRKLKIFFSASTEAGETIETTVEF
jgi:hypothetical protein